MSGFPMLTTMQGLPVSDLYDEQHMPNHAYSDALVSSSLARENEFHEQFTGGGALSSVHENPNSWVHLWNDVTRTHALNGYSDALNISFATSMNCGYDDEVTNTNGKWEFNKFPIPPEFDGKSLDPSGLTPMTNTEHPPYDSALFINKRSLSLAKSQSSATRMTTASGITHHCSDENRFTPGHNSCNSKNLSLSFGSQEPPEFSQHKYLEVIQEILSQIASYSLENLDRTSCSTVGMRAVSNSEYSSSSSADRGVFMSSGLDGRFQVQMDPQLQKRAIETNRAQLLTLLQVVDDRYNQCMDEIHTVVSAFHAATELDPRKHASFALGTISFFYKNLRERISNQILSMGGGELKGIGKIEEEDLSFEASFIQRQWALQQQKRKEHQLWRPQRGLPEKSVSVLRAWMFQNFLHPYPKDAEKHLLAIKSGLSRSQVSNWFINARVRLWKPMIEEMYSEMNKRKYEQGSEKVKSMSMSNHRYAI